MIFVLHSVHCIFSPNYKSISFILLSLPLPLLSLSLSLSGALYLCLFHILTYSLTSISSSSIYSFVFRFVPPYESPLFLSSSPPHSDSLRLAFRKAFFFYQCQRLKPLYEINKKKLPLRINKDKDKSSFTWGLRHKHTPMYTHSEISCFILCDPFQPHRYIHTIYMTKH